MKLVRASSVLLVILTVIAASTPTSAVAQRPSIAVGLKASTLGLGGEVTIGVNKHIGLRGNGNFLSKGFDWTLEDIDYNLSLDWKSGMLLIDLHPMGNAFRLSGVMLFNGNKLEIGADPTTSVEIGGTTYVASDIGTLTGQIDFNKAAPYFGLGFASGGRFGISFDLGAAVQGTPKVNYTGTTTLTGPAATAFNQSVATELADIRANLDDRSYLKFYPVLALGLQVRF